MGRIIKKIVPYILMVSILFSGVFGVFGILGQNEKQIAYAASAPVPPIQGINSGLDKVPPTPSGGGCSLLNLTGCIDAILAWVGNLVLWTMARLVWLTGGLLFFVMKWNLQINELLKSLPIVDIGWKLFRDMANMLFIFALLWIAISTIIGRGGAMKKAVTSLIIAAVLINFSLFFSRIIIDASNIIANGFYVAITPDPNSFDGGLSRVFMESLRLQSVYGPPAGTDPTGANNSPINPTNSISVTVFGSLFMIAASFVFFATAMLFLVRLITLIILMMLSPLAFVGGILPRTQGMASMWWNRLIAECLFAPVYMALIYVVMKAISTPTWNQFINSSGGNVGFAKAFTGSGGGAIMVVFSFFIITGLLLASLKVARSIGGGGASMAIGWASRGFGAGVGAISGGIAGGTRWIGRQVAENEKVSKLAERSGFVGGGARAIKGVAGAASKSNLDVRAAKIPLTKTTLAGATAGFLSTQSGANVNFGQAKTKAELDKEKRERSEADRAKDNKKILEEGVQPDLTDAQKASMPLPQRQAYEKKQEEQRVALTQVFNKISTNEVVNMSSKDLAKNAAFIAPRQLEAIDKSDKFIEQDKDKIKTAHFAPVKASIDALHEDVKLVADTDPNKRVAKIAEFRANGRDYEKEIIDHKQRIRGLAEQQINLIDPETYNTNATDPVAKAKAQVFVDTMAQPQFKKLSESDRLTASQKNALKTARVEPIKSALDKNLPSSDPNNPFAFTANPKYNPTGAQERVRRIGPKDMAGLDVEILTHPNMLDIYTPKLLQNLGKQEDLVDETAAKIKQAIISEAARRPDGDSLKKTAQWLESADGRTAFLT